MLQYANLVHNPVYQIDWPIRRGRQLLLAKVRMPIGRIGIFSSDVCQKSFTMKLGLEAHKDMHTGVRPFVCQKTFQRKYDLGPVMSGFGFVGVRVGANPKTANFQHFHYFTCQWGFHPDSHAYKLTINYSMIIEIKRWPVLVILLRSVEKPRRS